MRARRWSAGVVAATAVAATAASGGGAEQQLPRHPRAIAVSPAPIELPAAAERRYDLPAGAVAYVAEDHTLPLVEIAVALRVGSFLDPPDRVGLASLTGTLISRGGAAALSAEDFEERVDELGLRIGSRSLLTRAGASLSAPTWTLDEGLDLLFSMLSAPRFEDARFETAVANLRESMGRRNHDPMSILEREWEWLLLGSDHFSTRPVTAASVAAIERHDLVRFHRRHWRPQDALIAVSGDVDAETIVAELGRRLAAWSAASGASPEPAPAWPPPAPAAPSRQGLFHAPFDGPQAKVRLGHRLARQPGWTERDSCALQLAIEILGGSGAISRLAGRLRTAEGLVYRASASYLPGSFWPGEMRIFFDTASRSTPRALAAALAELRRLREQPVHPQELAVARTTLLSRLRLAFDTAEEVAGTYAEDELLDRPHAHWQAQLRLLPEISAEEVRQAAREFLAPERLTVLVVGRWPEIAGGGDPSELERIAGHRVVHLPVREPLTLAPAAASQPPEAPADPVRPGG